MGAVVRADKRAVRGMPTTLDRLTILQVLDIIIYRSRKRDVFSAKDERMRQEEGDPDFNKVVRDTASHAQGLSRAGSQAVSAIYGWSYRTMNDSC